MANIIPVINASGVKPKIINEMLGNDGSGNAQNIGTINYSSNKPQGALDTQADEVGTSFRIDDNNTGKNGRRFSAGLSNTDLSNSVCGIHITGNSSNRLDINTIANKGMMMLLLNGTDFSNYRAWTVRGNDSSIGNALGYDVYVIDPSMAGSESDTGTYDNTSLDQWGIVCDTGGGYSSNYCWWIISKFWRVVKSKAGACAIYGADASFQSYHDETVTEAWTLHAVASGLFRIVCPFKIGDGSTTGTIVQSDLTLYTPVGQADDGLDQFHVKTNSYPFYLDMIATNSTTLNRVVFNWGEASLFDFNSSVGSTVILNNCSFIGMGNITLGSDVQCNSIFRLATDSKVIVEGANINNSTIHGDCEINTTAINLENVTITGDLRINVTGDATMKFTNCKVGGVMSNNNASNKLTINRVNTTGLMADPNLPDPDGDGDGQLLFVSTVSLKIQLIDDVDSTIIVGARVGINHTSGTMDEILNADTNSSGRVANATFILKNNSVDVILRINSEIHKWVKRRMTITPAGLDLIIRLAKQPQYTAT